MSELAPLHLDDMTPLQRDRRQRVVDAVIALVEEGRFEDLQMRDVADRSGVALGTVYRYFASKDHLFAAALVAWARTAERPASPAPDHSIPPADRLGSALRRAMGAYRRRPAFARLLVMVAGSNDPYASECFAELRPVVFGELERTIDDVDPDTRGRVMVVVGAVWHHCMVEWVLGRMSPAQATELLETTCELVLGSTLSTSR